jgi:hypothetical protein
MAIMIMLKNRKRNESIHKAYQQCSFPIVKGAFADSCAIRGRNRKMAEKRLLTEYKLLGGR